jgi:hypothetical protein
LLTSAAQQRAEEPETVMVTLRAKPGSEAELERVIARHWATAHELKLVQDAPHITLRGAESGDKTYFIEIFTWRDAGIPDAAPAEIRKIWDEMNRLVEARGGRPGLEFAAVSVVAR